MGERPTSSAPAIGGSRERGIDRRSFVGGSAAAMASAAAGVRMVGVPMTGVPMAADPHFAPRARRIILLTQIGAPSQIDLFDPKPLLRERDGEPMPDSLVRGQEVDQLVGRRLVIAGSRFDFRRCGESGIELSELLPHLGSVADRLAVVRSLHTDVLNHDPAHTMLLTGSERAGRPSLGAWLTHALGSANGDLPAFVVMTSGTEPGDAPPARLWGAGFLPGSNQGVLLAPGPEPVPFLRDGDGVTAGVRRAQLDAVAELNGLRGALVGDPAIATRTAAYEMAYRMQSSVPELVDLSAESRSTLALYGAAPGQPSFANNCLLARRLAERGVRVIQLCHGGWDHHFQLPTRIRTKALEVDRACAALLTDLHVRGMLDDTLVVFAGEFGRTPMNQGGRSGDEHGRDHHSKAFSGWLAGGGVRGGQVVGATDEFGYAVTERPVHVHDLQATILHLFGLDHERLTHRFRGRDFRLTDVGGRVVPELL